MIIALKLNLSKIDKSALFKGEKGTYLDLSVFVNDEPDQFGNDVSARQDLGKDRREEKLYIGNGKIVGNRGGKQSPPPPQRQEPRNHSIPSNRPQGASAAPPDDYAEEDDIPF